MLYVQGEMEVLRQQLQQVQGEVDAAKQRHNKAREQLQVGATFLCMCLISCGSGVDPQHAAFLR